MAVMFASDFSSPTTRDRQVRAGKVRALVRGVWTDEMRTSDEDVVSRHWRAIVGALIPGAVVTDRSAFAMRPENGQLFVSHKRTRPLVLPGLTVYPDAKKDNQQSDDVPLGNGLYAANRIRALIDNAERRGRPSAVPRRLTRDELHDEIVRIVVSSTPRQVDRLLEEVKARANDAAADDIAVFIAAARGHVNTVSTGSKAMMAAQRGEHIDTARVARFREVVEALQRTPPVSRPVNDPGRAALVPFYESYFSNYIEGSTLTIGEAKRVVFEGADVGKASDAHDIRATWDVLTNRVEMTQTFATADEFMAALRDRHRAMMAAHPDEHPGEWKTKPNRAGVTVFVAPDHVVGTLRAGWEEGQVLTDPFQRAAYVMFLISEVHPFQDGNGRSARVAMNMELVRDDQYRIIVPTVLRSDYMSALTRTTTGGGPEGLVRVLDYAQRWVAQGSFENLDNGDRYLRATNALWDSHTAEQEGINLRIPKVGQIFEEEDIPFPEAGALPTGEYSMGEIAAAAAERSLGINPVLRPRSQVRA